MADEEQETLRALERRLGEASETAQRLMAEAAAAASSQERTAPSGQDGNDPGRPPPAGWQTPGSERSSGPSGPDLDALIVALRSLRALIPPEVLQRLAEALKEVLQALRSLIDWYIERLDRRPPEAPPVEDIPIE